MGNKFNENLKVARENKGMSQKDVAEKIGVAKSTYSLYESGNREPNVQTIKKIADILSTSADKLLGLEEEPQIDTLAAHFEGQKFTEDELEEILNFVEFVKNKRESQKERLIKYSELLPNAAHERTDIDVTDEMRKHDDDIMDDENF